MSVPGALDLLKALIVEFGSDMVFGAGTILDPETARAAILVGAEFIVQPTLNLDVIHMVHRYGKVVVPGALTPTEILTATEAGEDMVKVFPAALGGPRYMTNLKMVFPEINLIPSGGISLDTAADFIRCGACAVSGARNFYDYDRIQEHGLDWVTHQVQTYIEIVAQAKAEANPLP